jgi:hypothetical protein
MANLMNPADIATAYQGGLLFGQQQRDRKRMEGEREQLRNLAPQIMQGDPAAYTQAAAINPEAAGQYQSAGDQQYRRLMNVSKMMRDAINTGNPTAKQRAFQTIKPFLSQMAGGRPVPEQWDDSLLPGFEQFENRISMAQAVPKEIPSGFQQFQLTAQAAGLQPGTAEYQQAARIALGQEGRASSGGYSFEMIKGADGRERPARRNPRDGSIEVFTESGWMPLGGPAAMGGSPSPSSPTFTGPDGIPIDVSGVTDPVVRQQIMQNPGAFNAAPDMSTAQLPPAQTSNPAAFGVGRSPEEQAGLTTAAQQAAQTAALAEQERIKADAAIREATIKAQEDARIKREADLAAAEQKKYVDATTTLSLLNEAEDLIKRSTGSRAGAVADEVAASFGYATEGAQAIAELNPVAARLTLAVPRMEGPQSDADRLLYQKAAGDFANPNVPRETRMAALQSMRRLANKYKDVKAPSRPTNVPSAVNPQTGERLYLRNGQWVPE